MGWILAPVIPPKLWPKIEKKHKRAITFEEHQQIIQAENNTGRKMYYELLWEIGSAQTDGSKLTTANIDWKNRLLSYHRQKTGERCMLEIGARLETLLKSLPAEPGQTICDPVCGTGGFLLAAHDYLAKHHALDRAQKKKLKGGTFFGIELVDSVTRLGEVVLPIA